MYHLVTGKPPFDGETPSAVMHKHLKQPLTPADHVNTALSAGVGEIIDVAMAKNRDERYQSTEDMLEDLRAVRRGEPPLHARRAVHIDGLTKLEETGKTVDLAPTNSGNGTLTWGNPAIVALMVVAGVSVVANLVMLVVLLTGK
jgi:serine/threonine-protein kinase